MDPEGHKYLEWWFVIRLCCDPICHGVPVDRRIDQKTGENQMNRNRKLETFFYQKVDGI